MSGKIDINSPEWCNIIFEGKNKDYGAYVLRKLSVRRHIRSLIIVITLFILVLLLPQLIKSVIPEKKDAMVEVTHLSDLTVELPKEKPNEIIIEVPATPIIKNAIKFTPPVIKPDEQVADDEQVKTQETLNSTNIKISVANITGNTDDSGNEDEANTLDDNKALTGETKDSTFVVVEQMPEFPGGEIALRNWINSHIKYPFLAEQNNVEGKVYVQFVVDKDGNVCCAKIVRSCDPSLEQEALRVVSSLPRWNPGRQRGDPVKVAYTVPINFILK
jgi:periplasmic protein TonB